MFSPAPQPKVFIIIPVHNRKEITIKCLETLKSNGDLDQYEIVVIDDGSTDGTTEAILANFPGIHLLFGDGNLWWTGAIEMGMRYAYDCDADYFIWLNDDTLPEKDAIPKLLEYCSNEKLRVISGQCYEDSSFEKQTYGGLVRKRFNLEIISNYTDQIYSCDCTSGNFVCFPRSIVSSIGYPPAQQLPHAYADSYYTWKAKLAGYSLNVATFARATSPLNLIYEGWLTSKLPIGYIWHNLLSPKSNLYPPALLFFSWKFYGWYGIFLPIVIYIKLILISLAKFLLGSKILRQIKITKDNLLAKKIT